MAKITMGENSIFLSKVECFRRGNTLHAPVYLLCKVTGMKRGRFFRFLNYNNFIVDESQKRMRKTIKPTTSEKVMYIKMRLDEEPDISLSKLGRELNCSRQSVNQLMIRYGIEKHKN